MLLSLPGNTMNIPLQRTKMRKKHKRDEDNGFEGGYMNAKISKLEDQFLEQVEKEELKTSDIFSGVSIFVNGYTKPSSNELKILMAEHGGIYHHYFKSGRTKFIIASNLPDSKVKNLPTTKIVKPEWVLESIKAGSLLDYKNFLLYTNLSKLQPRLKFQSAESSSTKPLSTSFLQHEKQCLTSDDKGESVIEDIIEDVSCNETQNRIMLPQEKAKFYTDKTVLLTDNAIFPTVEINEKKFHLNKAVETFCETDFLQNKTIEALGDTNFPPNKLLSHLDRTEPTSPVESVLPTDGTVESSDKVILPIDKFVPPNKNIVIPADVDKNTFARTANDPKFLSQYYNNSRLHHISQLGAGFKQYVNELRDSSDHSFPLRELLRSASLKKMAPEKINTGKVIMHIDMDCFFVSVGLRKYPHLRGQPVAVTHAKGGGAKQQKREGVDRKAEFDLYKAKRKNNVQKNLGKDKILELEAEFKSRVDGVGNENEEFGSMSEIASCSYEARALGLHNGMFMGPALRLSPNLKTIPYDFDGYKEVAYILYNTVAQYTLDIEAVSCDEMYVDCTNLLNDVHLEPLEFAAVIREEIKKKTGCPCSTGFGSNRLQARLATKKAKPDGQFYLQEDEVEAYFADISLGDLPGVGRQMESKLTSLGFTNCASLRSTGLAELQKHFGNKTGQLLFNYCRGLDDKALNFTILRKSISAGVNYGIRFEDFPQCETFLRQLCTEVCTRMSQINVIGKALTFKLMVRAADAPVETAKFMGHGFCDNVTKTINFPQATDNLDAITKQVLDICKKLDVKPEDMRGIGIQISKLESKDNLGVKKGGIQNFLRFKTKLAEVEPANNKVNHENKLPKTCIESNKSNTERMIVTPQSLPLPGSNLLTDKDTASKLKNMNTPDVGKKNKSLGLTGRKRGRPPKNASLHKEKNTKLNVFLSSNYNHSSNNKNEGNKYNFEDLDQDFLNALPEDLKSEILANCKTTEPVKVNTPKINPAPDESKNKLMIDPDYLAALPEDIRKEIESNISEYSNPYIEKKANLEKPRLQQKCQSKPPDEVPIVFDEIVATEIELTNEKVEKDKDILDLHWKDVRQMLRDWFKSTISPMQCDVDMIASYVKNLVVQKKLEELDYLIKFFYRTMREETSCDWHRVYLQTEINVQEAMLLIYRKKLKTSTIFPCCNP